MSVILRCLIAAIIATACHRTVDVIDLGDGGRDGAVGDAGHDAGTSVDAGEPRAHTLQHAWAPPGTVVFTPSGPCGRPGLVDTAAAGDGAGGVVIVCAGYGPKAMLAVRAQRVDGDGVLVWPVPIPALPPETEVNATRLPTLFAGADGPLLAVASTPWASSSGPSVLRLQRILRDGTLGFGLAGAPVEMREHERLMARDGADGVWILGSTHTVAGDVLAERYGGVDGARVDSSTLLTRATSGILRVTDDGEGGLYLARLGAGGLVIARMYADGSLWPAGWVLASSTASIWRMRSDANGVWLVLHDQAADFSMRAYALRITNEGEVLGLPKEIAPYARTVSIASDGEGGGAVLWTFEGTSGWNALDADGAVGEAQPVLVPGAFSYSTVSLDPPRTVDGDYLVPIVREVSPGQWRLYLQLFSSDGVAHLPDWGLPVDDPSAPLDTSGVEAIVDLGDGGYAVVYIAADPTNVNDTWSARVQRIDVVDAP